MNDEHADFLNGLHVVEYELERVIGELDEMQDRLDIPRLDRVSLDPLQWALGKLADDLHDVNVEIRNARLEVASARREASEARERQQAEQLQSLSIFNGLRAERDAANEQHAVAVRKYDAEVERRLALEKRVAELTTKAERKPWMEWQPPANVDKLYKRIPGDGIMVHNLIGGDRDLQKLYEAGWRYLPITPENELTKKAGELPADPAPEPYQWQVGDEVVRNGDVRSVEVESRGYVKLYGLFSCGAQSDWERAGWGLYSKASDFPNIPPMTPQQMADFAEALEQVSDSVGTDGEGQS